MWPLLRLIFITVFFIVPFRAYAKDFYDVLNVSKTATTEEIRTAYRRWAQPPSPELISAYRMLIHPDRRRQYDAQIGNVFANYKSETRNPFAGRYTKSRQDLNSNNELKGLKKINDIITHYNFILKNGNAKDEEEFF